MSRTGGGVPPLAGIGPERAPDAAARITVADARLAYVLGECETLPAWAGPPPHRGEPLQRRDLDVIVANAATDVSLWTLRPIVVDAYRSVVTGATTDVPCRTSRNRFRIEELTLPVSLLRGSGNSSRGSGGRLRNCNSGGTRIVWSRCVHNPPEEQ